MSYLVEQPPYCDLLRLSPATGRFVLRRRANLFRFGEGGREGPRVLGPDGTCLFRAIARYRSPVMGPLAPIGSWGPRGLCRSAACPFSLAPRPSSDLDGWEFFFFIRPAGPNWKRRCGGISQLGHFLGKSSRNSGTRQTPGDSQIERAQVRRDSFGLEAGTGVCVRKRLGP